MAVAFSGHDLTTKEILLYLPDAELATQCRLNREAARICRDEGFWQQKIQLRFPGLDTNVKINKRVLYILESFIPGLKTEQDVRILAQFLFPIIDRLDYSEIDDVFRYTRRIFSDTAAAIFKFTIISLYAKQDNLEIAKYYDVDLLSLLPFVSMTKAKEVIDLFYEKYEMEVQEAIDNDHHENWIDDHIKSPNTVYFEYSYNWPADKALLFLKTCFEGRLTLITMLIKRNYYSEACDLYIETENPIQDTSISQLALELKEILPDEKIVTFLLFLKRRGVDFEVSDLGPLENLQRPTIDLLEREGIYPTENDLTNNDFDNETRRELHQVYVRHGGI